MHISCVNCGSAYPQAGTPYCCQVCGGLFDFQETPPFTPELEDRTQPGIWRYRHSFGLPEKIEPVSLGEGNTPLLWTDVFGRRIALKCEYMNPSGSFKDRGSAIIAAWLRNRGVVEAVEDSSGNAGASFAAYASRADIKARIFIPASASGPKRRQIEAYGADLVPVTGSRSDVSTAVRKVAQAGTPYASHAFCPFNLPGYATAAYEIVAQIGQMPGTVILPAGQGGFLLGLKRGFDAVRKALGSAASPRLIGVQARVCSPLWDMFWKGGEVGGGEGVTLAEGVRVSKPTRSEAVIAAVRASGGEFCVVSEDEIMPGRDVLARLGFYVEPTSAIVVSALEKSNARLLDPVVVILTGSGLKYG
jgi:threonine synthase